MNRAHQTQSLDEALAVLEDAAREKKGELQRLIGEKYHQVRDILSEAPERMTGPAEDFIRSGEKKIEETVQKGQAAAKKTLDQVNERIHENPMPFISGVAVSALLLGFILGNGRQK